MLDACTFHSPKLLGWDMCRSSELKTQKKSSVHKKKVFMFVYTLNSAIQRDTLHCIRSSALLAVCHARKRTTTSSTAAVMAKRTYIKQRRGRENEERRSEWNMQLMNLNAVRSEFALTLLSALHVVIFHKSLVRWWFFACGLYGHFDDKQRRRRRWRSSAQSKKTK